jgi:hypothetical protein
LNRKPYQRKVYWNEPTLSWWERAYLFEILRGLGITGGVFVKNMWRWITGRKGALTTYYPEETRSSRSGPTARRSASRATCARPSARRR